MSSVPDDLKTPAKIAADIARELREHPTHWTKGELARDALGYPCNVNSPDAVCWCLSGHIVKRVGSGAGMKYWDVFKRVSNHYSIPAWNDAENRAVDEVIALCEKAAVS